ncbi:dTDP-4-dehydrorhamnose reductase [Polynucleobacter asymbioticus]|uniref:dTDP-4-dehydrorhamnose reductase n=1 Tax=Polynucleobacter asymbioticus (strain DSM 18221 / CIP 109841 / QLW-P1DMWA-1) TaxID=312153 RepID=A4SVG1_POLAQ|nr:dTDP-4-dehydrorhamnose reductase [Polynucleobacter asymbioticus]ABP33475.1 dTDP-4-dehydrorhamnose reductase [Polynucleobacter asymbioticus QLW-P1DMWA-1]
MKVLVFGKDGQLGKAFQQVFSALTPPHPIHVEFLGRAECDLCNPEAIATTLDKFKPNIIINSSAYTAVDKAETEVDLAYAINARAPELMAAYAAEHGATFLHYSTDYVFDGEKYGFYLEDDVRSPLGVYGKSKAAGEEGIARIFANSKLGQYAILRTSWVYGDGGNFIRTILRLAKEREELKVIADQYGVPTSAQWLAQVSLGLTLNQDGSIKHFPSGIYHAVPAGETTWHGLATLAVSAAIKAGVALKVQPGLIKPIPATEYPLPAPRPANSRMSTDKLQSALGGSRSYNEAQQSPEFPQWEQMVQEYVSRLASRGEI